MKRIFAILCLSLTIIAAFSCDKQEEWQDNGSLITIIKSNLKISAKGGDATIKFASDVPVKVTVDKDWCIVSVDDTIAILTASANNSFEPRYTKAVLKAGDEELSFTIHQAGFYTSGFAPADIKIASAAAEFDFPYEYEDRIVASSDADWITVTATDANLHIAIAENETIGSPENPARYAEISWSLGHDSGVIGVSQNNLSFMRADANWTVHYDGVHDYQGQDAAFISNDVADPSVSGKYSIYAVPKADFTASGMNMDDFAQIVADDLRDEIEYVIDRYGQYGYNLTWDDLLFEDSDYEVFDPFDPGDYLAFAIGFTSDGAATGHYAYSEFTVKSSNGATGYEAWLGEWKVKRGSGTDTWKITAKTSGSTYNIEGIEGDPGNVGPIEARYDSANDALVLSTVEDIKTFNSSYGTASLSLYGQIRDSEGEWIITQPYDIFMAKHTSDSEAKVTPTTLRFDDGDFTLINFGFFAKLLDGQYAGQYLSFSDDFTDLPNTMVKVGGGDNPGSGSEAYNKFLGTWTVESSNTAFNIVVSQNEPDKSFKIYNWQMSEDWIEPLDAVFNADDASMTVMVNPNEACAERVDIGESEPASFHYFGKVNMDGKEYRITSSGSGYSCATVKIGSDGKATMTGNDVSLSDGGTYPFCRLEIMAIIGTSGWTFNNRPSEFPLTWSKAGSSSSVKTLGSGNGKVQAGLWNPFDEECLSFEPWSCRISSASPRKVLENRKAIRRHIKLD